jgi:hypothetical protein
LKDVFYAAAATNRRTNPSIQEVLVRNALTAANMTTPNAVEDRQLPDGLHTWVEPRVAQEKTGKSIKVWEVQPKLKTSAKEMSQA